MRMPSRICNALCQVDERTFLFTNNEIAHNNNELGHFSIFAPVCFTNVTMVSIVMWDIRWELNSFWCLVLGRPHIILRRDILAGGRGRGGIVLNGGVKTQTKAATNCILCIVSTYTIFFRRAACTKVPQCRMLVPPVGFRVAIFIHFNAGIMLHDR